MQSSLSECDEGSVFPSPVIETSLSRVFGQFVVVSSILQVSEPKEREHNTERTR